MEIKPMISLTTQSEYLVELSEDQQEVVSGGGYYHKCYKKDRKYYPKNKCYAKKYYKKYSYC